jgi:glycosyltransferase involved in cell wall biosynthesis
MEKPVVLVLLDYFLPAYKAGGSVRTLANIIERLRSEFSFCVLTRDRDQGDERPFDGIDSSWMERDGYRVKYLAPRRLTPWAMRRAIRDLDYDLVYLNSFFSKMTVWILGLRKLGLLPDRPVLLASRGELGENPIALKRFKKPFYIRLARLLGLYRDVIWHASSERERAEIERFFGGRVLIAADLPETLRQKQPPPKPSKVPGEARFVFLSRLARKKNLSQALRLLTKARGEVTFDIYGTSEDPAYWAECQTLMGQLPANVKCEYKGSIPYEQVHETLTGYHFFLFPTLSENFGHVILEALLAGLPLVISNESYWVGLSEKGAGYDLPLADENGFVEAIQHFIDLDDQAYREMSERAWDLGRSYVEDPVPVEANRRLFHDASSRTET